MVSLVLLKVVYPMLCLKNPIRFTEWLRWKVLKFLGPHPKTTEINRILKRLQKKSAQGHSQTPCLRHAHWCTFRAAQKQLHCLISGIWCPQSKESGQGLHASSIPRLSLKLVQTCPCSTEVERTIDNPYSKHMPKSLQEPGSICKPLKIESEMVLCSANGILRIISWRSPIKYDQLLLS